MKLEKFNLEDTLNGRPVITGDGRKVTDLYLFKISHRACKLYGVICGEIESWTENGYYYPDERQSRYDLFHPDEEKKERVMWVNEYRGSAEGSCFGFFYKEKDQAISNITQDGTFIATRKVTIHDSE